VALAKLERSLDSHDSVGNVRRATVRNKAFVAFAGENCDLSFHRLILVKIARV